MGTRLESIAEPVQGQRQRKSNREDDPFIE